MTSIINILEEMHSKFVAQNCLQPISTQLVAGSTNQINQITAQSQDIGCIEGWFIVTWSWFVQIDIKERSLEASAWGRCTILLPTSYSR